MRDPLQGLNAKQQQAVRTTEGPLLVLAGAGSGKTRVLTHRIAYIVQRHLARPRDMLAITFTNKAAAEMRSRLTRLLGATPGREVTAGTFHSLGARVLREFSRYTRRSASFVIADESDAERLVRQVLGELKLDVKTWSPRQLRHVISRAKNDGRTPDILASQIRSPADEVAAKVYARYEALLAEHDSYDFDDLLIHMLHLLHRESSVRRTLQRRWRYISIDEYQDTNPAQDTMVRLLLGEEQNVCAVGDDYQAIYSWRGARVDHILRFAETYPDCTTVYLTQNYRSTPNILAVANQVIAENTEQMHKQLWTAHAAAAPVTVVALPSDRHEAAWVRQAITTYIASGGRPRDCAVLYRTNAQSRRLEEEFMRAGVPYTIIGGVRFWARAEVKDAMALLQLLVNPAAVLPLRRVLLTLAPGVGPKTVDRIVAAARARGTTPVAALADRRVVTERQHRALRPLAAALQAAPEQSASVGDVLETLLENSGYLSYLKSLPDGDERRENIAELITVASEHSDATAFIDAMVLHTDADSKAASSTDSVWCLTLHAAKGLEFERVFVVGCEEGLLPHRNSLESHAQLEEERRLLYVGITRARQYLALTYAGERTIHGDISLPVPSRFLAALPEDGVQRLDEQMLGSDPAYPVGSPALLAGEPVYTTHEVGDIITHQQFGHGVVIQTAGSVATCVFEGFGVRTVENEGLAISNQ